jgi:TPR repeat protein
MSRSAKIGLALFLTVHLIMAHGSANSQVIPSLVERYGLQFGKWLVGAIATSAIGLWITKAWGNSDEDRKRAQQLYDRGMEYLEGKRVSKDPSYEARSALEQSAKLGYPPAKYMLGVMFARGTGSIKQDKAEAYRWISQAASDGYVPAMADMGVIYYLGWGRIPKDLRTALTWTQKAVEHRYPIAQYRLGVLYANGEGVDHQDYLEAAQWYRRAADQGLSEAQYALGYVYANGEGVPQDFVYAYVWLHLAVASYPPGADYDRSIEFRDRVFRQMSSPQQACGQELASRWHPPQPEPPPTIQVSDTAALGGQAPFRVNFTVSVCGGVPPYTFLWDFGEEVPLSFLRNSIRQTSTDQNPTHTYPKHGSFTSSITVTDSKGQTATQTRKSPITVRGDGGVCNDSDLFCRTSGGKIACCPSSINGQKYGIELCPNSYGCVSHSVFSIYPDCMGGDDSVPNCCPGPEDCGINQ